MADIMAFCENCKRYFRSSIGINPGVSVKLTRVGSVCPYCSTTTAMPDGIYSGVSDTLVRFTSLKIPPEQVSLFIRTFQTALKTRNEPAEIEAYLQKKFKFTKLLQLPKTLKELIALAAFLVLILSKYDGKIPQAKDKDQAIQIIDKVEPNITVNIQNQNPPPAPPTTQPK
jgi:hypothetical protein